MKKTFETPEIEVSAFQVEDILTTSGDTCGGTAIEGQGSDTSWS